MFFTIDHIKIIAIDSLKNCENQTILLFWNGWSNYSTENSHGVVRIYDVMKQVVFFYIQNEETSLVYSYEGEGGGASITRKSLATINKWSITSMRKDQSSTFKPR